MWFSHPVRRSIAPADLFSFFFSHLATTNAVPKKSSSKAVNGGFNKENIPSNSHSAASSSGILNQNRAILAVSIVQKPLTGNAAVAPVKSSNVLKSVLKKSLSTATSSSNLNNVKPKLTKQNTVTGISKLYDYAEIQKKKKDELVQKLKAEEEKEMKFKFHAKPAPKVKAPTIQVQQQVVKQHSLKEKDAKAPLTKQKSMPNLQVVKRPAPVVPMCGDPERIRMMDEHKKRLIEKYKQESVNFKAKPASVLQKPFFQPKHNFKAIDSKPFKLLLTQRLIERSTFDKQLQQAQAMKKKQDEIYQRAKDLNERRQMRQAREFRANPNPFGRGH